MNFLYPGFLFALISVIIPILIHLFQFRKFQKVYFSNVAFLQEIESKQTHRNKLKQLLILICRVLAITFLVFAFARPYLGFQNNGAVSDLKQVSIYIDNSQSMELAAPEGSLLMQAKRKAKELVMSFDVNTEFQIITNDFQAPKQGFYHREEALTIIDEIKIVSQVKTLSQVTDRIHSLTSYLGAKNFYILSDFQQSFVGNNLLLSDTALKLHFLQIQAPVVNNLAIDSVWFAEPEKRLQAHAKVVIRTRNYGDEDQVQIPVKLFVGKVQKAAWTMQIKAQTYQLDTISLKLDKLGWQNAYVEIQDSPILFDNLKYFSYEVKDAQKVVLIQGEEAPSNVQYVFDLDAYFKLHHESEVQVSPQSLASSSIVFLSELENYSSGLAQMLKTHLASGTQIVLFPKMELGIESLKAFLSELGIPAQMNIVEGQKNVQSVNWGHHLFQEILVGRAQQFKLPEVQQYFQFQFSQAAKTDKLMEFANGDSFLSSINIGKGKLYLFSSGLNNKASNFAQHPLFLPILHRLALLAQDNQSLYYHIGKDSYMPLVSVAKIHSADLRLKNEAMEIIPSLETDYSNTSIYVADQIQAPGFYELWQRDQLLAKYAFNFPNSESELKYADTRDFKKIAPRASIYDINKTSTESLVTKQYKGQEYWKLCLILSLVFILLEILLVRFYKIKTQIQT